MIKSNFLRRPAKQAASKELKLNLLLEVVCMLIVTLDFRFRNLAPHLHRRFRPRNPNCSTVVRPILLFPSSANLRYLQFAICKPILACCMCLGLQFVEEEEDPLCVEIPNARNICNRQDSFPDLRENPIPPGNAQVKNWLTGRTALTHSDRLQPSVVLQDCGVQCHY